MRRAVPHTAQQIPANAYSQDEHDAAYGLGQFGAEHWLAARKAMPAGAVLADWRNQCARDFLSSMSPEGQGLLPSMLAGFDAEAEERYPLGEFGAAQRTAAAGDMVLCIDAEDADEWLTLGKAYRVHAVVGSALVITDDSGDTAGRHHASHFVIA
ncbi:hypothetical protein [Cupriavidus taiwanensis]|uniref:Uncharacterized protein n=1 Tax=Cupriavidus taiwanensis TaxID=164546 RepID=A0A975WTZ0_9BURK|nr:hypothetical protein CBM2587_A110026 [Cupriavidus taiwanensis]